MGLIEFVRDAGQKLFGADAVAAAPLKDPGRICPGQVLRIPPL